MRPRGPNSFNFMQFLGRFVKILGWCSIVEGWGPHLSEILDPPLCNSSASSWCYSLNRMNIMDEINFLPYQYE